MWNVAAAGGGRTRALAAGRTSVRLVVVVAALLGSGQATNATEIIGPRKLHSSVEAADAVVIAQVIDADRGLLKIERRLKGDTADEITLVEYVDGFMDLRGRTPLVRDARELMFLQRKGDTYAPVQNQWDRLPVSNDHVIDPIGRRRPQKLTRFAASIAHLVELQTRAGRGGADADAAYRSALTRRDEDVQTWAIETAYLRVNPPSTALGDAVVARWSRNQQQVANAVMAWRWTRAARPLAERFQTSRNSDERGRAAMAVGGSRDRAYLPLLRRVASSDRDPRVRGHAYRGISLMLGLEALDDLRRGAQDADVRVRLDVVSTPMAWSIHAVRRVNPFRRPHLTPSSPASVLCSSTCSKIPSRASRPARTMHGCG
jgi:HEAT repeats